jgi:hypothetical protein
MNLYMLSSGLEDDDDGPERNAITAPSQETPEL